MQPYSKFVRDLSDKYDITMRQAVALWKELEHKVDFDRMMDPQKFSHLNSKDMLSEEISRRIVEKLTNPQDSDKNTKEIMGTEEAPVDENAPLQDEFAPVEDPGVEDTNPVSEDLDSIESLEVPTEEEPMMEEPSKDELTLEPETEDDLSLSELEEPSQEEVPEKEDSKDS